MGKMNELSQLVSELNKCGETLISISESLASMFSTQEEAPPPAKKPEKPKKKAITLEQVRAVLAEKSRAGHTAQVRELLEKYGAAKLSEIDSSQYPSLLAEAEVLGNG